MRAKTSRLHGPARPAARAATVAILVATLLQFPACPEDSPSGDAAQAYEIQEAYESGPISLTVKVDRREITAADRIELVLEALAPEDQQIEFPTFDEKLEEFHIVDSHVSAPRLVDDGRVLISKSFELEPFLPGEYAIPAMAVRFGPRDAEDNQKQSIETAGLAIDVKSVLPDSPDEPDIKEIAPPVELPDEPRWWLYATVALAILALAAAGYYFWRHRQSGQAEAAKALPPHEVAYRALEQLLAEDLLMKGDTKLFYLRLSNILRHYIEDRFGLRAPERTTEEFMDDLRTTDALVARRKDLLKEFLRHCDMVKFAEHQPSKQEIDDTIGACRRFVDETKVESAEEKAA